MRYQRKLNLTSRIIPKSLREDDRPLLIKSGETEIIEIGRVIKMNKHKTKLGYKTMIIHLHVGASVNQPYISPQIEDWRVSEKDIEEVEGSLKNGMLIAVQGIRRTFVNSKENEECEKFQHINVVEKISILSSDESFVESFRRKFRKEFESYDECRKP